ncbi:MAG: hydroxyacylglutathione hydrolase [Gammaproteobacteria bacterium]
MPVDTLATALDHPRLVPIPAFADNYIWAVPSIDGSSCAVIDPGDADAVRRWLADRSTTLRAILITHHHADHTGGVAALKAPGVRVIGPRHEAIANLDEAVGDGDHLALEGIDCALEVLEVPGHTTGHIAFHGQLDGQPVLFCGDTLFSAGCGRLFEGTAAQMNGSLAQLAALPARTLVCCAHEYTLGNLRFAAAVEPLNPDIRRHEQWAQGRRAAGLPTLPSDLAREKRINPFLRTAVPAVIAAAAARAQDGSAMDGGAATFAALRGWKDNFR